MYSFTYSLLQIGIVISVVLTSVTGEDYCHFWLTCSDGYICCNNNIECCPDTRWLSTAAIIGIVIGGVIFVTVVVGVIVALACGCKKTRAHGGNVVYPSASAPVQIISTGQMHVGQPYPNYGQPYYQYPPPPPVYSGTANQAGTPTNIGTTNQVRLSGGAGAANQSSGNQAGMSGNMSAPTPQNPPVFHKQPLP